MPDPNQSTGGPSENIEVAMPSRPKRLSATDFIAGLRPTDPNLDPETRVFHRTCGEILDLINDDASLSPEQAKALGRQLELFRSEYSKLNGFQLGQAVMCMVTFINSCK